MAIAVSIQVELVGEDPILEVASFINEAVIKAPIVNDIVPQDVFFAVLEYVSRQFSLIALSNGIPKELLEPITEAFGGGLASEWQFKAADEDFYMQSGISDNTGKDKWIITIEIFANCENDRDVDDAVIATPITGTVH